MKSTELSCQEFVALLASDAPAPGGGGAAALVGALGTALSNMVGSLTVGKPKYAEVEAEVRELKAQADALQTKFLELVAKDAEVFEPLSRAYGLPKATVHEAAHKEEVMETCLMQCSEVPLEIMKTCCTALDVAADMEEVGTVIALSDVGCSAASLKAALLSAHLNVRVNTKLMKNRRKAEAINTKAQALLKKYVPLADKIYQKVQSKYN